MVVLAWAVTSLTTRSCVAPAIAARRAAFIHINVHPAPYHQAMDPTAAGYSSPDNVGVYVTCSADVLQALAAHIQPGPRSLHDSGPQRVPRSLVAAPQRPRPAPPRASVPGGGPASQPADRTTRPEPATVALSAVAPPRPAAVTIPDPTQFVVFVQHDAADSVFGFMRVALPFVAAQMAKVLGITPAAPLSSAAVSAVMRHTDAVLFGPRQWIALARNERVADALGEGDIVTISGPTPREPLPCDLLMADLSRSLPAVSSLSVPMPVVPHHHRPMYVSYAPHVASCRTPSGAQHASSFGASYSMPYSSAAAARPSSISSTHPPRPLTDPLLSLTGQIAGVPAAATAATATLARGVFDAMSPPSSSPRSLDRHVPASAVSAVSASASAHLLSGRDTRASPRAVLRDPRRAKRQRRFM